MLLNTFFFLFLICNSPHFTPRVFFCIYVPVDLSLFQKAQAGLGKHDYSVMDQSGVALERESYRCSYMCNIFNCTWLYVCPKHCK